MTDFTHIEKQIRHMGDPHAQRSMGDCLRAADTMQSLLRVAKAAEEFESRHTKTPQGGLYVNAARADLREALDELKESPE
jgi:hypothetical protein